MADEQKPDAKAKGEVSREVAKPVARSLEDKIADGVAKWVDKHLRNTPFSADTPAWNHFQAALPHLAGTISEEVN